MLSLDSPKWSELKHAYGVASDIPALLLQLEKLPTSDGENEPWFSLWSSLAHQGDVYPASFAAVPYVVRALKQDPINADFTYFQFPAWVEVCRQKKDIKIPIDLEKSYFEALSDLPSLVAIASDREWDANFLCCALSAIAAAKGFSTVAEAAQELNPEVAKEFMEWFYNR